MKNNWTTIQCVVNYRWAMMRGRCVIFSKTLKLYFVINYIYIYIYIYIGLGMWRVWVRRGGVYRVLLGKPEGRKPLGRTRRRWVDKIRMDLQERGCGYMDWIGLAQDIDSWRTLVSAVVNLRVP